MDEKQYWRNIWQKALSKMPRQRNSHKGTWSSLCFCLGWPMYSKTRKRSYIAHQMTYWAWARGSRPRDEQVRHKLVKIATNPMITAEDIERKIKEAKYFNVRPVI